MNINPTLKRILRLIAISAIISSLLPQVRAEAYRGRNWFKFAIIGDHRGQNKAPDVLMVPDPANPGQMIGIGYKDRGINTNVLKDLAVELRNEQVDFVLDVGDLVSKWIPNINGKSADALLAEELSLWATIWNENSKHLPIYPIRGNQEVTASKETWRAFTRTMPGIGWLPLKGPAGEEGLTFSFKHKNCLFIGVDHYASPLANGDTHTITPEALAWIDKELRHSGHKFVIGHTPAYEIWDPKATPLFTVMKDGLATPIDTDKVYKFNPAFVEIRDAFWDMIAKRKAEYYCGHDRVYNHSLAVDTKGRWARQTMLASGGEPINFTSIPAGYTNGPHIEAYAGIPLPTFNSPPDPQFVLQSPLVVLENPLPLQVANYGYVLIEVKGGKVKGTFKAKPGTTNPYAPIASGPYTTMDEWIIKHSDEKDKEDEE
jgi:hypothetical protein